MLRHQGLLRQVQRGHTQVAGHNRAERVTGHASSFFIQLTDFSDEVFKYIGSEIPRSFTKQMTRFGCIQIRVECS